MIILFLTMFVTVLGFSFFTVSTKITGINRVMVNMPKEIFQASIPLVQDGDFIAYYDKRVLENNVESYLRQNLSKFTKKFRIAFYYYNQDDGSMCITNYCDAVEVSIRANVVFNYNYSRTMFYEIRKGNTYGL